MNIKIQIADDSMIMLMPCMLLAFFVFYKIAKKRDKELKNINIPTGKNKLNFNKTGILHKYC